MTQVITSVERPLILSSKSVRSKCMPIQTRWKIKCYARWRWKRQCTGVQRCYHSQWSWLETTIGTLSFCNMKIIYAEFAPNYSSWCPKFRSEISVQVDARIPLVNGSSGFFVAARVDQGGCETFMAKGLFLYLLASEQRVVITGDLGALYIVYMYWNFHNW